jgi:hypothetical protein
MVDVYYDKGDYMVTNIQRLEQLSSQLQLTKMNKLDKTALGISWVLITLEKEIENEEKATIKKWSI